jgi:MYXO-CTERM domain-containing protein
MTCTTQCMQMGAIFCDGSYVEASDVGQCVTALNVVLTTKITVAASATGTSSCTGSDCTASGTAKASCAAAPGPTPAGSLALFGAFGAVAIVTTRRRRR